MQLCCSQERGIVSELGLLRSKPIVDVSISRWVFLQIGDPQTNEVQEKNGPKVDDLEGTPILGNLQMAKGCKPL